MRAAYIYCLCDPGTGEIRYIGKTCDPHKRLIRHLGTRELERTTRTARWLRSLLKLGLRPVMEIIEEFDDHDERWMQSECFFIAYLRFLGMNLTNHELGGLSGKLHSEETKALMSESAKAKNFVPTKAMIEKSIATRQLPEYRAKRSAITKRQWPPIWMTVGPVSEETRRKQSEAAKRRRASEETKQKMRIAKLGKKHTEEARARMSAARKRRHLENPASESVPQERRDRIRLGMIAYRALNRAHKAGALMACEI